MYRDEWGYGGNRNGAGQCRRDEKYKGKKEHTQVSEEDLSIRKALFSRFREIGIQFGSPDKRRSLVRGDTKHPIVGETTR